MIETRYDPIHGYDYTYWPDSKYFRNYKFSPPISVYDDWSYRSRVWFPYYWSTRRLFEHYMDYRPSDAALRDVRRMICTRYYPTRAIDYPYYPVTSRYYRPLSLYYNYYYPLSSLSYYDDVWPYYPYYRYLYYKYTLPSDRWYYSTKSRMIYLRDPISGLPEYRIYPTASYLRHKVYKPLSLYCDYYEPIRSLYWNSSYWPMYRSVSSFINDLPSDRALRLQRIFDDETRLIRAQTSSLLRRIHDPVPRVRLNWPTATTTRYDDGLPARFSSNNYIHKMLITSPRNEKVQYTSYYTEPVRKYIGHGHLSCVSYAGGRAYDRRPYVYMYENPLQSDIQLLSYYINKFRKEKAISSPTDSSKVPLSPLRPSRKWAEAQKENESTAQEMKELREARAARLAFINEEDRKDRTAVSKDVDEAVRAKKQKEDEARLAEEARLVEEKAQIEAQAKIDAQQKKKEEAARKAELARQEELAAQAAADRAAELERQAELTRQKEQEKQAEIERKKRQEDERVRIEEEKRLEEEAKAEEERQQLLRLEKLAKQAEEEKEAELARQAEELAELARQEAELEEQRKQEAAEEEKARQEAELEDLKRQEEELAELERQEAELAAQADEARQEAEAAQKAKEEADTARKEEELAQLAQEEAELAELERQQAELDALDAEAKAFEEEEYPQSAPAEEPAQEEAVEEEEEQIDPAKKAALEELARDPVKKAALEELVRDVEELEELERAQAELDALEEEAKAMAADFGSTIADDGDDDEPQAIAEDVPGVQSDEEVYDE